VGIAQTLKVYTYKFQLPPQILVGSQTVPGTMTFSTVTGAGSYPLLGAASVTVQASANGLPQYYDICYACPFRFTDLQNRASFAALYDAYKFGKVSLNLEYLNNVSLAAGQGLMPTSYMYWDQDDDTIPPNLLSISGKQGVKIRQFGDKSKTTQRISFVPKPQSVVTIGATGSPLVAAGIPGKNMWLDCVEPGVAHYAIKGVITDVYLPGNALVTQAFRFNWTYNMAFRAPILTC